MSFSKKCQKSILTGAKIRKKLCWIRWWCPFCLKPSKMMSFWQFSFLIFFTFLHFFIFLARCGLALQLGYDIRVNCTYWYYYKSRIINNWLKQPPTGGTARRAVVVVVGWTHWLGHRPGPPEHESQQWFPWICQARSNKQCFGQWISQFRRQYFNQSHSTEQCFGQWIWQSRSNKHCFCK